jgi:hypothetical protein
MTAIMIVNQKIYEDKRLVISAMDAISESIWPLSQVKSLYGLHLHDLDYENSHMKLLPTLTH